ncbi:hypothetical protein [Devosia sp. A16]|uniref:hypothetical protein n=1 Tax=Devosia sp. A16 TaxID=1736675 RepID=UPI0012E216A6|nr:hypothetical protein [Devosia sp. A16]
MPPIARTIGTIDYEGRPFVYVVRFCGTEESSVASAIRQAIGVLDNFLQLQHAADADELIIVYRNRLPGAVTLQVGFPVDDRVAEAAGGEIFAGLTPSGPMVQVLPGGALQDVLRAGAEMPEGSASFTWQSFSPADFRPWRTHPFGPVLAPAELAGPIPGPEAS